MKNVCALDHLDLWCFSGVNQQYLVEKFPSGLELPLIITNFDEFFENSFKYRDILTAPDAELQISKYQFRVNTSNYEEDGSLLITKQIKTYV